VEKTTEHENDERLYNVRPLPEKKSSATDLNREED